MTMIEVWVVLFFMAVINIALVVGRFWGADVGIVVATTPVALWIGLRAASELVGWYQRRPKPLPRAIAIRR